jgi:hypothetical protein
MKQPMTSPPMPPPPQAPSGSVDTATLELLASWRQQDATTDPEQVRAAERELAEFKKAMNESRAGAGKPSSIREPVSFTGLRPTRSSHPSAAERRSVSCRRVALSLSLSGSRMIVPAIAYYELKRELLRARKSFGVARLDAFVAATSGRYLPLSDEAL